MMPMAKGALLALTAGIRCEAVLDEAVFLVQKAVPIHNQGGPTEEASAWGPPDAYTEKIYGTLAGGEDEISQYSNSLSYNDPVFVAGEWEDCCGGFASREVTCKDGFTADVLPESECFGLGLTPPPTGKVCTGGPPSCENKKKKAGLNFTAIDYASYTFADLGPCFAWPYTAHESPQGGVLDEFPLICQGWAHYDTPCRGGLPYGAFKKDDGSPMDEAFCTKKCLDLGMDAFGIEHGKTCRCGPLMVNLKNWGDAAVRNELVMRPNKLKLYTKSATVCPLKVYYYRGAYEDDGIPHDLQSEKAENEAYVLRINTNAVELVDNMEDGHDYKYWNKAVPVGNPWDRSCYPDECTAGLVWKQDGSREFDDTGLWAEKTTVPIIIDEMVDQTRKDVLSQAIKEISDKTCVNFKDVTGSLITGKFLAVVGPNSEAEAHKCYTQGLGMPPPEVDHAYLEMGSCNNYEHMGNVVHVLMEVLGIGPEQQRPDALLNYNNHGPYISNADYAMAKLEARFTPMKQSKLAPILGAYMGSKGLYKSFDYKSIMMTDNVHRYLFKVPESVKDVVGQRHGLSDGDIAMINDIYSCFPVGKKKTEFPPMDPALEEEIRLNADRHHEQNVKDLEKAEKFQPEVAIQARAILERISK